MGKLLDKEVYNFLFAITIFSILTTYSLAQNFISMQDKFNLTQVLH